MFNILTSKRAGINEIRIEKTARRKFAEVALIFWGVVGGFACLYMTHQALHIEMEPLATHAPLNSTVPVVIMYTFVWIGILIFLGFFALLAPIRMELVPSQAQNYTNRETFEHAGHQTAEEIPNMDERRAKAA